MSDTIEFECAVDTVLHYNESDAFCVLILDCTDEDGEPIRASGVVPNVNPGDTLQITGQWVNHPKYGMQIKIISCAKTIPQTRIGLIKYLSSGYIRGVGPSMAQKIVDFFGDGTIEMLDHSPHLLMGLPGIGKITYEKITTDWSKNRNIQETMVYLQSYGIGANLAFKLHSQYGQDTIKKIQENPYQLAGKVWGVGFQTANKIGQAMKIPSDSPFRIEAGISYVLAQAERNGHTMLPRAKLVEEACKELFVPENLVSDGIDRLGLQKEIVVDHSSGESNIYLESTYFAEQGVAENIARIVKDNTSSFSMKKESILSDLDTKGQELGLTPAQILAVQNAVNHKVSVLCGSPGTGKTTALKVLVDICTKAFLRVELASPTGRAAKRMQEATGAEAQTIHRLLGNIPGEAGFFHNNENPLKLDLLIIDEASMLDTFIMNALLKAVPDSAHIMFVGDPDQLPSVGAGNVLQDMIDSSVICLTKLTDIFRQAGGSLIIENAHRINQGEMPIISNDAEGDFFFSQVDDPLEICDNVVDLVAKRIPAKYGFDPKTEIQVFAPMKRGEAGIGELNRRLREALNPVTGSDNELHYGDRSFRVNDKVLQTKNNYNLGVLNGDIGMVVKVMREENQLAVDFDGYIAVYEQEDLDQLILAYATSVHKGQGSEVKCGVVVIHEAHYIMLRRNLLYTAITRGKKLVVVVGSKRAIQIATKNSSVTERHTGLSRRLLAVLG